MVVSVSSEAHSSMRGAIRSVSPGRSTWYAVLVTGGFALRIVTGVSQTRVPSVARKTPHPGLFPAFTRTRIVSDSPRLIPLTVCCFAERIPKDSGAATVNGPLRSGSE